MVLMQTSLWAGSGSGPLSVKAAPCSEWKTCFVLNQKPLAGSAFLLWLHISVTAVPGARPSPPTLKPSLSLPPAHFCPLAVQRGRFSWKQTTTNKRPKWGEECSGGVAKGELLCEIIARNNFKQMSVWTWPWARVPVKYSDLIGKQAVWDGLVASRTIRGFSNDPRGSRGRWSKSRSERMWGQRPRQGP